MNERVRVPPGERRGRRALPYRYRYRYRYLSKIFVQTESSSAPKKEARESITVYSGFQAGVNTPEGKIFGPVAPGNII